MSRFLAAGIAVCLALSACTGTPGAEPSPSASATSAGTPTPSASDPAQDPLYLEAVEVYKAYLVEILKLERAGGAEELPESLTSLIADDRYSELLADLYRKLLENGTRMAPQPQPVSTVAPNPGVSLEGSDVSILSCVDARAVPQLDTSGKQVGNGSLVFRTLYFKRSTSGDLQVLGAVAEVVETCPLS